jgi:hypothetical protein
MPLYMYEVLIGCEPYERFEVEQNLGDPLLRKHPITGEPVRKLVSAASISLKHSDQREESVLYDQNLAKHGFTKYEKADADHSYHRTAGNDGPPMIES